MRFGGSRMLFCGLEVHHKPQACVQIIQRGNFRGMTDPVTIELIRSISSLLTSIGVIIIGFWVRKLEKNTNSMKDELVKTTAIASEAIGNLKGRAEHKAELDKGREE